MHSMKFRRAERGISLLEVLISLLILSLGALGFAGLQLKGLKTTEDANYRAQATLIAQDAVERLLSNPGEISAYLNGNGYTAVAPGSAPPTTCMDSACSSSEMAAWDKSHLVWTAANSLPAGQIMITDCAFNGAQCVIVSWNGMAPGTCSTASGINNAIDSTCLVLEVIR
ncbi:type IV pilus modification protein PilV [Halopseudomonas bauzanensis]|uniref:Type IV pilus modification protein PilV n=1 Tax=Halopseudomonas bauzanensis TaxID=653930 RepID=A0A4U0YSY1_9GAMM|nr:type IV pilus modification protein PilV [Halopseudomonas bauzanensis]TKA93536.1 type IV pilus modification protein PilV [Halopseudomonas bauzanensis]